MAGVTRRCFLKQTAATAISSPAVFIGRQAAGALPTPPSLSAADAVLLTPADARFQDYQAAYNSRVLLRPQLRALCKTEKGVGVLVDWCSSNNVPFALRCGGHCYERLSQSTSVVIDTRLINKVTIDVNAKTMTVGGGASLGAIYRQVAPLGLAFTAGCCPTVGVAGHVLGGGYGYLARAFGLCCDSLLSVDLVDPQGRRIQADETQNPDLLWACRGGGGGCFGVATGFQFKLHPISNVLVFQASWLVKPGEAVKVIKDWQAWAPHAPQSIHAELSFNGTASGDISLRILGQSVGTPQQLRLELETLTHRPKIQSMPYSSSINYFAGQGGWTYASAPMKGKSDYVLSPLTNDGLLALITEVSRRPGITVICDPYGGAIAGLSPDATAFVHRAGTLFGIQYLSWWYDPSETEQRLANMRSFYAAMRPHVSGGAYVNYCDLDLSDWQNAYWGSNVPRLKSIKSSFDPDEVFRHAQSIPCA